MRVGGVLDELESVGICERFEAIGLLIRGMCRRERFSARTATSVNLADREEWQIDHGSVINGKTGRFRVS